MRYALRILAACLTLLSPTGRPTASAAAHWCPARTRPATAEASGGREEWCELEGGVKHGPYTAWYPSGAKKAAGRYRRGAADGRWTHWYENGNKSMEGKRRDDAVYGRWTYWYDNGTKRMEGGWRFRDGARQGVWVHWDSDGRRQAEGEWRDGHKHGIWLEQGARGTGLKWVRYEAGERTNESVRITMDALHQAGGVPPQWEFLPPQGDPEAGRRLFVDFGCHSCHAVAGAGFEADGQDPNHVGPELTGMGSHHPPGYFAESILNPDAVLIEATGYIGTDGRSRMPAYPSMTLSQLVDIVAYLQTLTVNECVHHQSN